MPITREEFTIIWRTGYTSGFKDACEFSKKAVTTILIDKDAPMPKQALFNDARMLEDFAIYLAQEALKNA